MIAPRSYLFTAHHSSNVETGHDRSGKETRKNSPPKRVASATMTPTTSTTSVTIPEVRPTTPSSPVVIPVRGHHDGSHSRPRSQVRKERQHGGSRRHRNTHSPDALSPSVAALLAITQIPAQRSQTAPRMRPQRLTVDAILQHAGVSEKEYSISLGKSSPLDFLLSPPNELDDEFTSSGQESLRSARTVSSESMPSLDDDGDCSSDASPSLNSLVTPGSRGRRSLPWRQMRTTSSPISDASVDDHPLLSPAINIEELDFRVYQTAQDQSDNRSDISTEATPTPRKSAFKSNLTASLRALRSAAKSFSSLTTPLITPDDFLTRSIISIDPQVPFTDERMPPLLEDTPTPALRRYLNPTTNAPIEAHVPPSMAQRFPTKCTASIQMQTYKVSRSAKSTSPSVISRRTQSTQDVLDGGTGPMAARPREMRENSDFIRIAVMEMAMRKKGKLDDHKPGRAKWALPPRKAPTRVYEIGEDGVPVRWVAMVR